MIAEKITEIDRCLEAALDTLKGHSTKAEQ